MMNTLLQDLRYGVRMLTKAPGFTAVAVLTLALGIGANTAIFSMVNALLLHPYDFHGLDRLVKVWENRGIDEGADARFIAPADAADLRANVAPFADLTIYQCTDLNLTTKSNADHALGCRVSANFFDVLGVRPALGREFSSGEMQPGRDQVVVLSHAFWERKFGGDPGALGQTIQIDGRSCTVVGIMPQNFDYPVPMQMWVPLALAPDAAADRAKLSLEALARLKPGASIGSALAALDGFSSRLAADFPKTNAGRKLTLLQLRKELYLYTLPLFGLLQAAAGFVLLLACANLANLLFARMIGRQKEIAVRVALGADRQELAKLFVCETILLSLLAAATAVAVSFWAAGFLRASISPDWTQWVPGWNGIQVDSTVLTFTILLAAVVGIFFGLATALHSGRVDLNKTLKEAGPGSMTRARGRLRSALVVSQVVFALVLLVCAGLTIQGFARIVRAYQGFDPSGVYRTEINLPKSGYADTSKVAAFYQSLLRTADSLPGVTSAGLITNTPASSVDNLTTFFTIEGQPVLKANETPAADLQIASAGYFETLRIPLIAGRMIQESDTTTAARVAVVSQSMAARYWPGKDAIGQRIRLGKSDSNSPWLTVVGVAGDVRQNWWNPPAKPTIYEPFFQAPSAGIMFVMRTRSNPTGYSSAVRDAVRRLDASVTPNPGGTLEREVTDSTAIIRIMGILMAVFGIVALALSSIGVYGVISESIAQRTHEIGIRLALGAHPRNVMWLVLAQSLKLTTIGICIALPISYSIGSTMGSLLYGLVSVSLPVLAGFTAALFVAALAAGFIPARRAMRTDPMVALRYE
ncbi:MAG TPA: ABC transporter permease [Candidatus Acidoferrales bacterium]|nr:ABC transporter permease [Candidatus Acidoferrales bacterium]